MLERKAPSDGWRLFYWPIIDSKICARRLENQLARVNLRGHGLMPLMRLTCWHWPSVTLDKQLHRHRATCRGTCRGWFSSCRLKHLGEQNLIKRNLIKQRLRSLVNLQQYRAKTKNSKVDKGSVTWHFPREMAQPVGCPHPHPWEWRAFWTTMVWSTRERRTLWNAKLWCRHGVCRVDGVGSALNMNHHAKTKAMTSALISVFVRTQWNVCTVALVAWILSYIFRTSRAFIFTSETAGHAPYG